MDLSILKKHLANFFLLLIVFTLLNLLIHYIFSELTVSYTLILELSLFLSLLLTSFEGVQKKLFRTLAYLGIYPWVGIRVPLLMNFILLTLSFFFQQYSLPIQSKQNLSILCNQGSSSALLCSFGLKNKLDITSCHCVTTKHLDAYCTLSHGEVQINSSPVSPLKVSYPTSLTEKTLNKLENEQLKNQFIKSKCFKKEQSMNQLKNIYSTTELSSVISHFTLDDPNQTHLTSFIVYLFKVMWLCLLTTACLKEEWAYFTHSLLAISSVAICLFCIMI